VRLCACEQPIDQNNWRDVATRLWQLRRVNSRQWSGRGKGRRRRARSGRAGRGSSDRRSAARQRQQPEERSS